VHAARREENARDADALRTASSAPQRTSGATAAPHIAHRDARPAHFARIVVRILLTPNMRVQIA